MPLPSPATIMTRRDPANASGRRASAGVTLAGPHPDVPLVHELDLPGYDLAPVLLVPVRGPVKIEVLGVDRRLVDELVLLGGQVLDPVVPLRLRAEPAERFDVDGPGHPAGPAALVLPPDDLPSIVDPRRPPAERVDRDIGVCVQVIGADIARDQVHVVVQGAG